ncbi:MAG: hypothetical protein KA764_04940 [Anaerolineales bacterium]|nr:hypothetical protein [Anaerolineales bacterium]
MNRRTSGNRRPASPPASPWPMVLVLAGVVLLGLAVYALLGGGAGGSAAGVEVSGAPRLRVDQAVIDLGEVKLGQTVEAAFRLTNIGDQPLRFAEPPYIEVLEGC